MSELKETKKKSFVLFEQTKKQFEPDPNPKNSLFLQQKINLKLDKTKSKN